MGLAAAEGVLCLLLEGGGGGLATISTTVDPTLDVAEEMEVEVDRPWLWSWPWEAKVAFLGKPWLLAAMAVTMVGAMAVTWPRSCPWP